MSEKERNEVVEQISRLGIADIQRVCNAILHKEEQQPAAGNAGSQHPTHWLLGQRIVDTFCQHVVQMSSIPLTKLFLDATDGKMAFVRHTNGSTPLHYAACNYTHGVPILQLLLAAGADINLKYNGHTPLTSAIVAQNAHIAIYLIEHGADVNCVVEDNDNKVALHFAACADQDNVVARLLDAGAEIDTKDISQHTPLMWAIMTKSASVIDLLLERGANTYLCIDKAIWMLRSDDFQERLVRRLVSLGASTIGCVYAAVVLENTRVLQILLDETEQNLEEPDIEEGGTTYLHEAAVTDCTELTQLLLNAGANIDSVDFAGCTPLWHAISNEKYAQVAYLLGRGASLQFSPTCHVPRGLFVKHDRHHLSNNNIGGLLHEWMCRVEWQRFLNTSLLIAPLGLPVLVAYTIYTMGTSHVRVRRDTLVNMHRAWNVLKHIKQTAP